LAVREIIRIDEEKCDGCGLCVPACAEGAIQIVNGKARLLDDSYCDGLGACLGECPQDAITIVRRNAVEYDHQAVEKHLATVNRKKPESKSAPVIPAKNQSIHACPGSVAQSLRTRIDSEDSPGVSSHISSQLLNWPVQLHLVPIKAPYFDNSNLLIAADCVPFANADFHNEFLKGKALIIGCPKLDDINHYHRKLTQIFRENNIKSIEAAFMEVPCCFGLVQLVQRALQDSGKEINIEVRKVGIRGDIQAKIPV